MAKQPEPQPPRHGVIRVSSMRRSHALAHMRMFEKHGKAMADYHFQPTDPGAHGTGFSSQGGFSAGGASGAQYSTGSQDDVGDIDSGTPGGL